MSRAESAQTDEDAARGALRVLGAKLQNEDRTDATCRSCHDPNKLTLKKWSDELHEDDGLHLRRVEVGRRAHQLHAPQSRRTRRPASRRRSSASSPRARTSRRARRSTPTRHPSVYKQAQLLAKLFEGKDDLYRQFKTDTLMPIEPTYDRLSPAEFEKVISWFDKGMPKLDELLIEEPRPTTCTDDFAGSRSTFAR